MEVKPVHILAASVAAFLIIIAANMVTQYQSNQDFREKFASLDPGKLLAARKQLLAEENMVSISSGDEDTEDE